MLVIFNYSVAQGADGLDTLCGGRHREKERVGLEQGTGQFRLTEVQGKCRLQPRGQCRRRPVVRARA